MRIRKIGMHTVRIPLVALEDGGISPLMQHQQRNIAVLKMSSFLRTGETAPKSAYRHDDVLITKRWKRATKGEESSVRPVVVLACMSPGYRTLHRPEKGHKH